VTEGTTVVTSEASRSAAVATEPQQAATAAKPQQAVTVAEAQQATMAAEARRAATAVEPQQATTAMVAITTMAITAPSTSPAPAPAGSCRVAAVEIPDDDVPPPGWDQWASLPTSAPEPQAGALMRRWDGPMMASRGLVVVRRTSSLGWSCGEPGAGAGARRRPPPHFAKAQAEQELWEQLCDHGASLNRALHEVLRIHGGPAWRVI
jgi:hypothetical protein